jgi:hypothetical protein
MAAGNTYTPIATTTLGSATSSITFSSISGSYTDLVLIFYTPSNSINDDMYLQYNSDTGSNYSNTTLRGNGTTASSTRGSNTTGARFTDASSPTTTTSNTSIINIMSYSNTTTYKSNISRGNNASTGVETMVTLWRNTAAITTIKIYPASGNMATGTIATLYGIAAA